LRRADWLAFAGYALLLCAYYVPLMLHGRLVSTAEGDFGVEWLWKRQYLGDALARGYLPQWNPYILCGTPLLASSQNGVFYPFNWLLATVPVVALLNAQVLLHHLGACIGMHVLARMLARSTAGSIIAALVFNFTAFQVWHLRAGHLVFIEECMYVPLILCGQLGICNSTGWPQRVRWSLVLAISLCLQLLVGHPQITYLNLLAMLFILAGQRPRFVSSATVLAATTAGFCLAAIQLIPSTLFLRESMRWNDAPFSFRVMDSSPPSELLASVAPFLFGGKPGGLEYLGHQFVWEVSPYVTAVATLLALLTLPFVRRLPGMPAALWAMLLFGWFMSLGKYGAYATMLDWFPGLALFRCPGRFVLIYTLAVALLAGHGIDWLFDAGQQRRNDRRWIVAFCFTIVSGLALLLGFLYANTSWPSALLRIRSAAGDPVQLARMVPLFREQVLSQALLAAGLMSITVVAAMYLVMLPRLGRLARWGLVLCVLVECMLFAWPLRSSFKPEKLQWDVAIIERMQQAGSLYRIASARSGWDLCEGMSLRIRHVWGVEAGVAAQYSRAMLAAQNRATAVAPHFFSVDRMSPFTRSIGMRFLLTGAGAEARFPQWSKVQTADNATLLEDPGALPRARLVAHAISADSPQHAVELATLSTHVPSQVVVLEGAPSESKASGAEPLFTHDVKVVVDEPEHFVADLAVDKDAWFVVMDQLLPGWSASLDGKQVPVYRADAIGRSIRVPAGVHRVAMEYKTPGLVAGLSLSCAMAMAMIAAGWWSISRTRGQNTP
jgi:hypothetical protein